MKKIISLLLSMIISLVSLAQSTINKYKISQLVGSVWANNEGDEQETILSFYREYYTLQVNAKKINYVSEHHYKYSLSNTPLSGSDIQSFDSLKLLNIKEGNYIVYKFESKEDEVIKYVDNYRIEVLNNDELLLYHKAIPGSIGGQDVYIKYNRIK